MQTILTDRQNMSKALELPQSFLKGANSFLVHTGAVRNMTSADLNIEQELKTLGFDINDFVNIVNEGILIGHQTDPNALNTFESDSPFNTVVLQVAHHAALEGSVAMIATILEVSNLKFSSSN